MKAIQKLLLVLLLMAGSSSFSQQKFPDSWLGSWKGNLEIYAPDGTVKQNVPMELHISKLDEEKKWQWKIVYNTSDTRNYELVETDAAKGSYHIDEKNNILIDVAVFGNKIFSSFEVQGFTIFDTHTLIGNTIVFELSTSQAKDTRTSGDGTAEIPSVRSFPQIGYQKAVLQKQ